LAITVSHSFVTDLLKLLNNIKIQAGTDRFGEPYKKNYYMARHLSPSWYGAAAMCNYYGMDMISFDTSDEAAKFLRICSQHKNLFFNGCTIGAMAETQGRKDSWYWIKTGKFFDFKTDWQKDQPDNFKNMERCMQINVFCKYNDIDCNDVPFHFACQLFVD